MSRDNFRLVAVVVALFFLFSGDPDVWDKLREMIITKPPNL